MIAFNDDVAEEVVDAKVSRKILNHSPGLMIVEVRFQSGGIGAPHLHQEHEQIGYILRGRFEVTVGDEKKVLNAGDSFYAGRNVMHGVVALEDSALLDIFTPRREDFLNH
jgi:quercetin dioxygenase-like cupin family protein